MIPDDTSSHWLHPLDGSHSHCKPSPKLTRARQDDGNVRVLRAAGAAGPASCAQPTRTVASTRSNPVASTHSNRSALALLSSHFAHYSFANEEIVEGGSEEAPYRIRWELNSKRRRIHSETVNRENRANNRNLKITLRSAPTHGCGCPRRPLLIPSLSCP